MKKIKEIWLRLTLNEKLMYGLLLLFVVGIILRWDFVVEQVSGSFKNLFSIE